MYRTEAAGAVQAAPERWTEARASAVKQLWADGLSASQIAMRLGGVTRNAVIGKVHRMGLPNRKTRTRTRPKPKLRTPRIALTFVLPKRRKAHPPKPYAAAEIGALAPLLIELLDLQPQQCRWPVGDPREAGFGFCGHHADGGYCPAHAKAAIARR